MTSPTTLTSQVRHTTAMAEIPDSLSHMPPLIWQKTFEFLVLTDMYRLHKTFPNIRKTCEHYLAKNEYGATFRLRTTKENSVARGSLRPSAIKVLTRLGQFIRRIRLHTACYNIEPTTFDCMTKHVVIASSALTKLRVEICSELFKCDHGTDPNWAVFIRHCTTNNTRLTIRTSVGTCCSFEIPHTTTRHDVLQEVSGFLSYLEISLPCSAVDTFPQENPITHLTLFTSTCSNLKVLSIHMDYVSGFFLGRLAEGNTSLRKIEIRYWPESYTYQTTDVSVDAWNNLTEAIPSLRVTCCLFLGSCSKKDFEALDNVFKSVVPVSKIEILDVQKHLSGIMEWCTRFANTLKIMVVRVSLKGEDPDAENLFRIVEQFCNAASHLVYINHCPIPSDSVSINRNPTKDDTPVCRHEFRLTEEKLGHPFKPLTPESVCCNVSTQPRASLPVDHHTTTT